MTAVKAITDTLKAMGATPTAETDKNGNTLIRVNAPTVPNCEICANRPTCKKEIGIIFGFCKTDFTPGEGEK